MSLIVPTVTAENEQDFNNQLDLVSSFSKRLHIDLMDGDFAPTKSPMPEFLKIPIFTKLDIHIMYRNPISIVPSVLRWHPSLIICHAESDININDFIKSVPNGVKKGVALLPNTPVDVIYPYLQNLDHVLVFGGNLGYHGGVANLDMLEKVKQLRAIKPEIEIAWDGGANIDNVNTISSAGVDIINLGGAIHNSAKPKISFLELVNKLKQ